MRPRPRTFLPFVLAEAQCVEYRNNNRTVHERWGNDSAETTRPARGLSPGSGMIIEMRTYRTKPGKRSQFLEIFRSRSVPAHVEIGMKILGPWLSIEDPDVLFFMRGFPDIASRAPMKAQFYQGALWKGELENMLLPMLEKYDIVLVEDPTTLIHW